MQIRQVEFIKGVTRWDDLPHEGRAEVAFIGRSNVGKSSLLNKVLGRRGIARTSGKPGKTREFNYYLVNNDFYLVDLPGFGYAKTAKTERARWGRFIGQYLLERQPLRLVFHLIDSRHPPMEQDEDIMAVMRETPVPYVIALTKTDKLSGNGRMKAIRRVEKVLERGAMEVPVVLTSAEDGRGAQELRQWMADMLP